MATRIHVALLVLALAITVSEAASGLQQIFDSHRSVASRLFAAEGGSFGSLEEAYEALRSFEILGVEKPDVRGATCNSVLEKLGSSSSALKDLYYALKVNGILKCEVENIVFEGITSRLKAVVNGARSLLDIHYSVRSLVLIKDQSSKVDVHLVDVHLVDADGVFRFIKSLCQSDGRWRYSSHNPESSTYAAGLAFEALAGVVNLASSKFDISMIGELKRDVSKLFDIVEKFDDGAIYFDEKKIVQSPLSTTASVVRGLTAFSAVTFENLKLVPGDKMLGLTKFFLGAGIHENTKDFFNQLDSLACLENNKTSVPLILSPAATVISLTKGDKLKVKVSTIFGSSAPRSTVKLLRVTSFGPEQSGLLFRSLYRYAHYIARVKRTRLKLRLFNFDKETGYHSKDDLPVDVGGYTFLLEIYLPNSEDRTVYTGGLRPIIVFVTGVINVHKAEIAVLENDESVRTQQKLDLAGGNSPVTLSANHLQKLRLSFMLTTSMDRAFEPHQVFLKLKHETKQVEHIFVVGNWGRKFEITIDFFGLVDKFYYLSGSYEIELTVGDTVMENSFVRNIGHIDLDLPEAPEKATRPPSSAVDPYLKYGPKAEISHIFRVPEKLPPNHLSLTFLGLTLLPLIGFLVGLLRLGVNLKNFPTSAVPATFGVLFHAGIAGVLLLYVLFWLKLDLFTTLKWFGLLGVFLLFVGHRILSHLASTSSKLDFFTTLKWLGLLGVFLLFVGHRILSHLAFTSHKVK